MEQRILSSIINSDRLDLTVNIKPRYFIDKSNREIFMRILDLVHTKKQPSVENIKTSIGNYNYKGLMQSALLSRLEDISKAISFIPTDATKILKDNYLNLVLRDLGKGLLNIGYSKEMKINKINEAVREIDRDSVEDYEYDLSNEIDKYIKSISEKKTDKLNENSIILKRPPLISLFGPKIRPKIYVIAGPSGGFKTSVANNLFAHFWEMGIPGMYFSQEDLIEDLRSKVLSILTGVDRSKIQDLNLNNEEKLLIKNANNKNNVKIFTEPIDPIRFRQIVESKVLLGDYKYIIIDYIQLISRKNTEREKDAIDNALREMISITKKHYLPIILLSQINRDSKENRKRMELILSDLKGSGNLGHDARFVAMIDGDLDSEARRWNIVKDTWGPLRKINIEFDGSTGRLIGVKEEEFKRDDIDTTKINKPIWGNN